MLASLLPTAVYIYGLPSGPAIDIALVHTVILRLARKNDPEVSLFGGQQCAPLDTLGSCGILLVEQYWFTLAALYNGTHPHLLRSCLRFAWLLSVCTSWLYSCGALRAQAAWSHQGWSVEEGLPQASVHSIFQSKDGYVWLATEAGIARFDGIAFKTFAHGTEAAFQSDDVSAIAETPHGLFCGTASGVMRYTHSEWSLLAENEALSSPAVLSLSAAADGSLLVLTARGVDRFDGARFQALSTAGDTIVALQSVQDGSVLLLSDTSIWSYSGGSLRRLDAAAQPAFKAGVQGLLSGPGQAVWTRTLRSVSVRTPAFQRTLESGRELPRGRVTALLVDRQGTGWIGTNHGLFFYKAGPASEWHPIEALRSDSVLSIFQDREGNLWIGTETSGVHALRPRKFQAEPAAAGEAVSAGTVTPDGTLWFGTEDDGVRRVRHGVAEQPVPTASLTSPVVLTMAHGTGGDVWLGTPDGLNRIQGTRVEKFTSATGLPDDYVRSVLVDAHGTVWASTRRGLVERRGSHFRTYTRMDGLSSDSVGPLVESNAPQAAAGKPSVDSDLWIGTAAGLSHLHRGTVQNFSAGADPGSSVVTAIAQEEDGTLWVGLHGRGLFMFAEGRFLPVPNAALPAEVISLVVDASGYLWLRDPHGLYRVASATLRACAKQAEQCSFFPEKYGTADGLPSDTVASQGVASVWHSEDGRLWFPTRKGIGVVDPKNLPFNRVPPPVVIQQFVVDETELTTDRGRITIGSGHHRYTFGFAALSYTLPARNRYRYQLEGFDNLWVDGGTQRLASYTSLPAGLYRFRVQAQNNDGVWSETAAELRFRILPPFYRTWWFLCLVLLLLTMLVLSAMRLQAHFVQRRFALVLAERTRIARDVHDTLAQDLVGVSLQLNLVKRFLQTNSLEQASSQLDASRKTVTAGLEAVRQSIWNLRADTSVDSLPTRLTQLVRHYATNGRAPYLRIGGAFRRLAPRVEGEVLGIAQEALLNSSRHAEATQVSVSLQYETDALTLMIQDNGRGFSMEETNRQQGHYGLLGMHERADALRARLTVNTNVGEGTTVRLSVPLGDKEHRIA